VFSLVFIGIEHSAVCSTAIEFQSITACQSHCQELCANQ